MHAFCRVWVGICLGLGSCSGGALYRDFAEPLTVDDFEPLPTQVTKDNARLVVRKCLQAHRRTSATPDSEYGYAFLEGGFVQLYHVRSLDREEERTARIYMDYGTLEAAVAEPHYNLTRLRDEFRVTLQGMFRKWESHVRSFRAQPNLGAEPSTVPMASLVLVLDDPVVAKRLTEALAILSAR